MASMIETSRYAARQAVRLAWYGGQYVVTRRQALRTITEAEKSYRPQGRFPDVAGIAGAMTDLFERDLANVAAGVYPLPDLTHGPRDAVALARRYFADVDAVTERRLRHGHSEVRDQPEAQGGDYPRYYLQNFHYQSGGWLSDDSAALYDHQVEVLFTGTADAMRRMALPYLKDALDLSHHAPRPRLLDVASGTGRFLHWVKRAIPRARLTALDLSAPYLARARATVASLRTVQAPAEAMPLADGVYDAVTSVYLFHELPPKVRGLVAAEMARVLRPGGRLVVVDALQHGDRDDFDGMLEMFPIRFHEPYFASYSTTDMPALFEAAGLDTVAVEPAFLSKLFVFDKPAR
ncbi:hypothetical protein CCR85_03720 [Rhodothalassium salexigens]|nr:hypothetical protein [Rhodothalassium salexigens]MBK5920337.1 hypothetical protein [Rhodothalassium salexigens]